MRHLLMAHQQESFSPFSMAAKSLLLPKPRGKKKHSKTSWSSLLSFRTTWSFSPLQNHMDLYLSTCFRASWFTPSFRDAWSPPHLLWGHVVSSFLPQNLLVLPTTLEPRGLFFLWLPGLGLNPSSHLPLQPIADSSYSQLHLPASPYSSSFTGLP